MKENNEVMNAKTKKTQTQPTFNLGDTFEFDGEQVKVVELLESGNVHLKKVDPPYSSFIVTEGEVKKGMKYVVGECGGPELQAPVTVSAKASKDSTSD